MAADKPGILMIGQAKPVIVGGIEPFATVHKLVEAKDQDAFINEVAPRVRGIAIAYTANKIDGAFMSRFPKLEIVSSFGVGYDHVDAKWAGEHGVVVTNTPDAICVPASGCRADIG
jgi:lactate dehydrogenase-like 2-hydroxyacid dehydrogenase